MRKRITVTGVNKVFFFFAVLFMIFQFILVAFTITQGENFITEQTYKIILVNEYIIILIPVLVYTFYNKLPIKETFRFNKLELVHALLIILASFPAYMAALMFNNIAVYFIQFFGDVRQQPMPVPQNIMELMVGLFIIALTPAICEELLHRGLLLKAYEKRGSYRAVVIVSILFGIFHFDITNFFGPVFLGLIIGYYVIRTNSIFAGILAHFMNNAIAEVIFYFTADFRTSESVQISAAELGSIIILGLVSLFILWLIMLLFNKATEGKFEVKPPISSVKNDIRSITSHWPITVISLLYLLLALLYIVSIASI
ncbi:MAG TPA: CPBP family intramembrane metalloprotease [Clostridiaceae bacterium]|nr:CPBP family intramembrane metalloprotease [Clostridiaceae bacterium]